MKSLTFFVFLILVALSCCGAGAAAEVRLDGTNLVVAGVGDSIGLGSFTVVLEYGTDLSVTSVDGLSGFMVAGNIRNDRQMTVIGGIYGGTPGPSGDVPVATVLTEGNGSISISVIDLTNANADDIPYSNPVFAGTIPTPEVTAPAETTAPATTPPATTAPVTAVETGTPGVEVAAPATTGTIVTAAPVTGAPVSEEGVATTTAAAGESTQESLPAGQPTEMKAPLSPFAAILALVALCAVYRMINMK